MYYVLLPLMVLILFGLDKSSAAFQRPGPFVAPDHQHNEAHQSRAGLSAIDEDAGHNRRLSVEPSNVSVAPLILESHHPALFNPAPTPNTPALLNQHQSYQPTTSIPPAPTGSLERLALAVQSNPVLAALLISSLLGPGGGGRTGGSLPPAYNTPAHPPPSPYVALLLSHYGRYIPRPGHAGHGLYGYNAANNIHNTRPFGSYKIYEDSS